MNTILISANYLISIAFVVAMFILGGFHRDGFSFRTGLLATSIGLATIIYSGVLPSWTVIMPILIIAVIYFTGEDEQ
jgi:hypothetical protein